MKKITLLLMIIACSYANAQFFGAGNYKIKSNVTGKYWTVDVANSNITTADEISGNDATQVFEIKSVGSNGYFNISCTVPEFDAVRFNSLDVIPTGTSTPTSATNNTRIITFDVDENGAYDIHTPQTTTGRFAFDDNGDVRYTGSGTVNTKWLLENTNPLSNEEFNKNSIFISNPISNQIIIEGINSKVNKVEVFNIVGKSVYTKDIKGTSSLIINATTLASGLYLVKVYGETSTFTKKIIKK